MRGKERATAHTKAVELLARREHSQGELRAKLRGRGYTSGDVEEAVTELADQGLQSDDRFLESFVAARAARGHGPLKIAAELRARGVVGERVQEVLEPHAERWNELARTVREKRFGVDAPQDPKGRISAMRFLAQRGFDGDQIRAAFSASAE